MKKRDFGFRESRARMVAIMTRDEHKPVGYWLIRDGVKVWVETRPASTSYTDIEREKARNRRCPECATALDIPKVERHGEEWIVELVCWRCGVGSIDKVPYADAR